MSTNLCENPILNFPLNTASNDKFVMVLLLPYILKQYATEDPLLDIEYLQIGVFGSVVPTVSIPPVEVRYAGQPANVSSHSRPNYDPLTINFLIDNKFNNYYVLWKWLSVLNDPKLGSYQGSPLSNRLKGNSENIHEYQTTLSIISLDEYNKPAVAFQYSNAFITSLGAINYSYKEGNIIESSAQFSFNQLTLVDQKKINTF